MNSIQTKKNEMNLFKIVEDYFERMLEEVPGMKCLVLDRETMGNFNFSFFEKSNDKYRNNFFDLFSITNLKEKCIFD